MFSIQFFFRQTYTALIQQRRMVADNDDYSTGERHVAKVSVLRTRSKPF